MEWGVGWAKQPVWSLRYERRLLTLAQTTIPRSSARSLVTTPTELPLIVITREQWRTQEFCLGGGGSTNSVEDRENGDLGAVAP